MNKAAIKIAMSLGSVIAAGSAARALGALETDDVLGWAGLERRRSRLWEHLGLVGAGACVGALGALLFAPTSGREARRRIGGEIDRLGDQAREAGQRMVEDIRSAPAIAKSPAARAPQPQGRANGGSV
jgi:hypothetical protein